MKPRVAARWRNRRSTRLNYGKLAQADTKEAAGLKPRLIESLEEIRI